MRFLDLFAGIGGFRLALEGAGHTCVGFCEIDKFARQTYKANFDTEGEVEWHDITTVTDEDVRQVGRVDIITGGFPCQAFSVAGKRGGFDDTRGTLFFEIARIARILRPRYLLLENVKGLLNHAGGATLATILNTMAELGYWWEYQVLNSKDFGVPQNRERVFIVGHLGGKPRREVFPITGTNGQALTELTQGLADAYRVYDPAGVARTLKAEAGGLGAKTGLYAVPVPAQDRHGVLINRGSLQIKEDEIANCLDANYHKGLDNHGQRTGIIEKSVDKPAHIPRPEDINNTIRSGGRGSLTAKHNHDTIHDGVRIRRLTPLECFRLQGFPDSHHDNAKAAGVSDSQLYKQAGNAVTVNVVYEIAQRLEAM
jgi:DNA (cytosine-5)-methyltransferase 1